MSRTRIVTVLSAFACAFVLMGLVACSSGNSSSSAASSSATSSTTASASVASASASASASSAAAKTDEQAIQEDFEKVVGTVISGESLSVALHADENMKQLEAFGLDIDSYAESLSKLIKITVKSVEVKGDSAVVKAELMLPDIEKADPLLDKALDEVLKDVDVETLNQDDAMGLYMKAMSNAFADPAFPTSTEEFDVDYVKTNGNWTIKDKDEVNMVLGDLGGVAKGTAK